MKIKRGQPCACGCGNMAHDLHHGLLGRRKNFPELDDERNLIPVNHLEHIARKFDNAKWHKFFWNYQVEKYGLSAMEDFINNLPTKLNGRVKEFKNLVKG